VIVAEKVSEVGGLGEAVATALFARGIACAFRHIGLPDAFLDAGALPTLHDRYGISTKAIAQRVKSWL
jgi:transketolase